MFSLVGKGALITGATGEIGSAIARTFAKQGCHLVLSSTKTEALQTLCDELKAAYGIEAYPLTWNLKEDATTLFKEAYNLCKLVDIVVNNAGINRDTLLMRMTDEAFDEVMNVNLRATFQICRAASTFMVSKHRGRIINISSIVGVTGNAGQTNYCATKAGIIGFSKALALEVAKRHITVNCIAPGLIQSAMSHDLSDDQRAKILQKIPMGEMGTAQDVANCALFLASDEAHYMTGQTLHINGGMLLV